MTRLLGLLHIRADLKALMNRMTEVARAGYDDAAKGEGVEH
ncbi:MAG: hypothetical protein ABIO86_14955 [Sphingomonas sp.]